MLLNLDDSLLQIPLGPGLQDDSCQIADRVGDPHVKHTLSHLIDSLAQQPTNVIGGAEHSVGSIAGQRSHLGWVCTIESALPLSFMPLLGSARIVEKAELRLGDSPTSTLLAVRLDLFASWFLHVDNSLLGAVFGNNP